jgi:hypothetical protein
MSGIMYAQIILDKPPVRVFNVRTLNQEAQMENELTNPLEIRGQWVEFNDAYIHEALCQWNRTKALMPERTPQDGWAALRLSLIGA